MNNKEQGPYKIIHGTRDEKPWVASIRGEFTKYTNKSDLPWLLQIHVDAEATDLGLVSDEEAQVLNTLEDYIDQKVEPTANTYFVGRITWNRVRSLYYYISDPKPVADELNKIITQGQYTREFQYEISKDAEWKKMLELIPNIENV